MDQNQGIPNPQISINNNLENIHSAFATSNISENLQSSSFNPVPNGKDKNKVFLILGIILIVCILGLVIGIYFRLSNKNSFISDITSQNNISTSTKDMSPTAIPTLISSSNTAINKTQNTDSKNAGVATEKEKNTALNMIDAMKKSLQCQYVIDKKYPDTLASVTSECMPPSNMEVPEVFKNMNIDGLNYRSANSDQDYYFEMPVIEGEGYTVTKEKIDYIAIPKDVQTDAVAKSRDSGRKYDLDSINDALQRISIANATNDNSYLCNGLSLPCFGDSRSLEASRTDGTGWIKININTSNQHFNQLPVDPVNNDKYHYIYCADQTGWAILATFESNSSVNYTQNSQSKENKLLYKIGSNLNLMNTLSGCKY